MTSHDETIRKRVAASDAFDRGEISLTQLQAMLRRYPLERAPRQEMPILAGALRGLNRGLGLAFGRSRKEEDQLDAD